MEQKELQIFIEGSIRYFEQISGTAATMGVPFIKKEDQTVILEYTGAIGISGSRRGGIYITATKEMLTELAKIVMETENVSDEEIRDIAGELANTISGNASESFGSDFMISVPIIIEGLPRDISLKLRTPVFVIPITWQKHRSFLVVGID